MVHVRKAEIDELKDLSEQLIRSGKELLSYGMIGYGGSIEGWAKRIKQIVTEARD